MMGRGQHVVKVDRRGLDLVNMHDELFVVTPAAGVQPDETENAVFLSLRF